MRNIVVVKDLLEPNRHFCDELEEYYSKLAFTIFVEGEDRLIIEGELYLEGSTIWIADEILSLEDYHDMMSGDQAHGIRNQVRRTCDIILTDQEWELIVNQIEAQLTFVEDDLGGEEG